MNQTFDISHIPPMTGSPQDTAAIAAEVSVAAAAQTRRSSAGCGTRKLPSSRVDIRLMPNILFLAHGHRGPHTEP